MSDAKPAPKAWECVLAAALALDPLAQRCAAVGVPIPPECAADALERCRHVWARGVGPPEAGDEDDEAVFDGALPPADTAERPGPADIVESIRLGACEGVGLAAGGTALEITGLGGANSRGEKKRRKRKNKAAPSAPVAATSIGRALAAVREASAAVASGARDRLCVVEGAAAGETVASLIRRLDAVRNDGDRATPSVVDAPTAADVIAALVHGRPLSLPGRLLLPDGALAWPAMGDAADGAAHAPAAAASAAADADAGPAPAAEPAADAPGPGPIPCSRLFAALRVALGRGRHPVAVVRPEPSSPLRVSVASPALSASTAAAGSPAGLSDDASGGTWLLAEFRTGDIAGRASSSLTETGWRSGLRVTQCSRKATSVRASSAVLAELYGRGWVVLEGGAAAGAAGPDGDVGAAAGVTGGGSGRGRGPAQAAAAGAGASGASVPPPMSLRVRGGGLPRPPGEADAGEAAKPPAGVPASLLGRRLTGTVSRLVGGTIGYVGVARRQPGDEDESGAAAGATSPPGEPEGKGGGAEAASAEPPTGQGPGAASAPAAGKGASVSARFTMRDIVPSDASAPPGLANAVRRLVQAGDAATFEIEMRSGRPHAVRVSLPAREAEAQAQLREAGDAAAEEACVVRALGPDDSPGFLFPRTDA